MDNNTNLALSLLSKAIWRQYGEEIMKDWADHLETEANKEKPKKRREK